MKFARSSRQGGGIIAGLFAPSDEQLVWRAQAGEAEAFGDLVARWEDPIVRLCARMTGDLSRGEDLAQEIFTKVFLRSKDFKPEAKFSTWLWRIALNHCYDELRKLKRRAEESLEGDSADTNPEMICAAPGPDAQTAAEEECELVRAGLLRLPESLRSVLALRYCEGLKLREISEILELPETTVHSRIAVGLAQLTRILEPQFGETDPLRGRKILQAVL